MSNQLSAEALTCLSPPLLLSSRDTAVGGSFDLSFSSPPSLLPGHCSTQPSSLAEGRDPYPPIRGEGELEADPPITADGRHRRAAAAAELRTNRR